MIKYDDIVPHPDEVEAVAKAIAKLDKQLSLSKQLVFFVWQICFE